MKQTRVTEYLIEYLKDCHISPETVSAATGIDAYKLKDGCLRPLTAEEFLELCVYLKIRPEDVWAAVKRNQ